MVHDELQNIFVDKEITHEEFVAGIKRGDLKLIINDTIGDGYDICTRENKNKSAIIKVIFFYSLPIIIIAYTIYTRNWWLLFGLIVEWAAYPTLHFSAAQPNRGRPGWFLRGQLFVSRPQNAAPDRRSADQPGHLRNVYGRAYIPSGRGLTRARRPLGFRWRLRAVAYQVWRRAGL